MTVAEVAAKLKLNQQTVRNWIDADRLPALRVGRRVRIKRSDFERLLEDSYSGGTPSHSREPEPTADGFWGGEPVGRAEPGEEGGSHAGPEAVEVSGPHAGPEPGDGGGPDARPSSAERDAARAEGSSGR